VNARTVAHVGPEQTPGALDQLLAGFSESAGDVRTIRFPRFVCRPYPLPDGLSCDVKGGRNKRLWGDRGDYWDEWGPECLSKVRRSEPNYVVPRNVYAECRLKEEDFSAFVGPIDAGRIRDQIIMDAQVAP
jgi:hypothetical protein